ncbi:hypothetical protein cce_1441 [Crocosphaera subtropica ATCC 51142]|uniref:Uncharacterized protein n=1 Tax=Crocosphaera subtropica (strain ATCC 51142 / BH68) TaxID=43989 RepID=B1WWR7_CROS5|nr:hypothetical protein cce_1441 [Crocosphaera subtropica ATCC 51142]
MVQDVSKRNYPKARIWGSSLDSDLIENQLKIE